MILCDFYVFGLIDGEGVLFQSVVNDTGCTVDIEGTLPSDHPTNPGETFYYEWDAYHLKAWAEENGMVAFKHGYNYDSLGRPAHVYEE